MALNRRLAFWFVACASVAVPALALLGVMRSERLRAWTASVLESSSEVQHRKAVLAARAGRFDESFALFDQALGGGASDAAWLVDHVRALSWSGRHAEVLRSTQQMPEPARSHPEVIAAEVDALAHTGAYESVPGALARMLDGERARGFLEDLASRRYALALRSLREGLRGRPERAPWAERHLADALRWSAVSGGRSGNPVAALALLDDLAGALQPPSPALLADQLVLLCWADRASEAVARLVSAPTGLQLPEYALTTLARAWREDDRTASLPDDTLGRLLGRTLVRPDLGSELIHGCRSARQLESARASLPVLARGDGALTDRYLRAIEHRLAVLVAREGRHADAVPLLVSLLDRDPDDAHVRADLVTVLSWAGRHAEAVRWARSGRGGSRLPEYALRALERSREALEQRTPEKPARQRRRPASLDRRPAELAGLGEIEGALSRARLAHHDAMVLARRGEHEKALASLDRAMDQLDSAARRRSGSSPKPRRSARRPGRARPSRARVHLPIALTLLLAIAPRAHAETSRLEERPAPLLDAREDELRRLRLAVAWDRVVVLSWAGKHWEAVEAFEALPEPRAAPPYVTREAAESYRATYRPGTALELYGAILAADPKDAQALDGLRSLFLEQIDRFLEPGLARLAQRETAPPPWLEGRAWSDRRHGLAVQTARKGDPAAALRELRDALQTPRADRAALQDYLVLLYVSRRYPEVVALSRAVPEEGRGSVEPLVCAAHVARGHLEEALSVARRWRARSPEEPRANAAVVHRLLARGLVEEAKSFVERLPADMAERLAGDVLLHGKHPAEAEARYLARLGLVPGDAEAMLGLAAALAMQGRESAAEARATSALKLLPVEEYLLHQTLSAPAALALARTLNRMMRASDAIGVLTPLLAATPDHVEALWALGQARELQQERLEAAQIYERILRIIPGAPRATEARARVLLELTAVRPVRAEMRSLEKSATALDRTVLQTQAVEDWTRQRPEPRPAALSEEGQRQAVRVALARRRILETRARATVATLRQMASRGGSLQEAALRAAAEAHVQLDEPARALELYRALEARIEERGAGRAERFGVQLAQARCLSRMMRFEEAGELLDRMDAETAPYHARRGELQPNWDKAELAAERGWWLLAQNRLGEAEEHFALMLRRAPQSAAALSGLADTHLLRGRPRLAQREYEEASSVHPDDVDIRVGLAQALHANGEAARAERIAGELASAFPEDRHVGDLARKLEVARKLELSTATEADFRPGIADGLEGRLGFQKPVGRRVVLGFVAGWKREGVGPEAVDRGRTTLSGRFAPYQGVTVGLEASNEPADRVWGAAGEIRFAPTDRLSFGLRGDSETWSLPPGAVRARVSGRDLGATAEYRQDETFAVETRLRALELSDGNLVLGATAGGRLQLLATGAWRALIGISAGAEASRLDEPQYYSPARTRYALLSPSLEHVWRQSRSYRLHDRWTIEGGIDYESGAGAGERWGVGYEQGHGLSDAIELNLAAALSRRRYGGTAELGWRFVLGSSVRF